MYALQHLKSEDGPVNLGSGFEISIKHLALTIKAMVDYQGEIEWDHSMPNGQPNRVLSSAKAYKLLAWQSKISLTDGLKETIEWYLANRH